MMISLELFLALIVSAQLQDNASSHCDGMTFVEVSEPSGFGFEHRDELPANLGQFMGGGVAAGDFDQDGWVDLYVMTGSGSDNRLMRNKGDGTFVDVADVAGVSMSGAAGSGPTFVDLNGDGFLDLIVGSLRQGKPWVFENNGDGTFADRTADSGLPEFPVVFSIAASDLDRDGDLDLFFSQWNATAADPIWVNDGGFRFSSATESILGDANTQVIRTFSPNFVDIDANGWPDLLIASDFGNSQVLLANGDGTLSLATDSDVIVDENGMGAAVGDYDNDGNLDWFVTSIYDPEDPFYQRGNRLYRGLGDGQFEDATEVAGIKDGSWGWGACFADFNNDGLQDIFHVNGWRDGDYADDSSRLFIQNSDNTFEERAAACGIDDRGQGRGVVCLDYDLDGDLDIFVANNSGPPRLYRNEGGNELGGGIEVVLRQAGANAYGIGAQVTMQTSGIEQRREIQVGSNFASQNPASAFFGTAEQTHGTVSVQWPNGKRSRIAHLPVGTVALINDWAIFSTRFESSD